MDETTVCTIPEYYAKKCIFITGGSGFMGKVLIEKLLRSCPGLSKIYLLLRAKKGLSIDERWQKLSESPVFSRLRDGNPDAFKKIKLVEGEITTPNLGLKECDEAELIENVNIIFHVAASVQFAEDIRLSLNENTKGTLHVAELAKSLRNFEHFVYVSTSYCNIDTYPQNKEEKIYKPAHDWKTVLNILEREPEIVSVLKDKILMGHPTTYTFSKSLAEQVMQDYSDFYSVIVVRPSVVTAAVEEPMPGWIDALNGVIAVSVAGLVGVLRVSAMINDEHLDYICVDHAIKTIVSAPWLPCNRARKAGIQVYGCNYGSRWTMSGNEIMKCGKEIMLEYPSSHTIWYPYVVNASNRIVNNVLFFFLNVIPAYLFDMLCWVTGKKQRLVWLTKKMATLLYGPSSLIASKTFSFGNQKFQELNEAILPQDKAEFYIDFSKYTPQEIFEINHIGVLKYFLKEDLSPDGLKKSQVKFRRLYYLHLATCAFFLLSSMWLLYHCIF